MEDKNSIKDKMAEDIHKSTNIGLRLCDCNNIAEVLCGLGYTRIPENAIVLSKEDVLSKEQDCWNRGFAAGKDEGSKETAESILTYVSKEFERVRLESEFQDDDGKWLIGEIDFIGEITLGALPELYRKYGIDFLEKLDEEKIVINGGKK